MAIDLRQSLKMQQNLVMTPQLQMAIKTFGHEPKESQEAINNELVENPVLEDGMDGEEVEFGRNEEEIRENEAN